MTSITFDTLAYSKKLTKLGFTQEQAEGFARLAREQNEVNNAELQKLKAEIVEGVQAKLNTRDKPDDSERSKLATKSDVADVRLEVGKVRGEVEKVCGEIEKLRGETKSRETASSSGWAVSLVQYSSALLVSWPRALAGLASDRDETTIHRLSSEGLFVALKGRP